MQYTMKLKHLQGRRNQGGGARFWADQLTLSQPGGQIMPTTVLRAPRIFRPCDGPEGKTNLSIPEIFKFFNGLLEFASFP